MHSSANITLLELYSGPGNSVRPATISLVRSRPITREMFTSWVAPAVAGPSGPSNGQDDAFIGKYDPAGNLQWTVQLGTAANDYAYGVAVDSRGNALVVGATQGSLGGANAGGYDAFLSKYDAAGNLKWTRQFGTSGNDFANGISTDGFGNFYVTGNSPGFLGDPNDPWLAKFTVPNVLGDSTATDK